MITTSRCLMLAGFLMPLRLCADLGEATDFGGTWSSGTIIYLGGPSSSGFWVDQSDVSLDAVDAAEGKLQRGEGESWVETSVTGPATLYFSYRIKDYIGPHATRLGTGFFLGVGDEQSLITDLAETDTDWHEYAAAIPAGTQTVRWKLSSLSLRGDIAVKAYLDQVWVSSDPRPRIPSLPDQAGVLATPYSWTVPVSSATTATLSATGLPPGLTLDPNTFLISGSPTTAGSFDATLTAFNAGGQHVGRIKFQIEPGRTTLPEALDTSSLAFTQPDGATTWEGITSLGHDGVDSARASLPLGPPTFTGHLLTTTINGPGTLTFWYRNDERGAAHDRTLINLYVGAPASPPQPAQQLTEAVWTQVSITVPAGPNPVSWGAIRANFFGPNLPVLYTYLDGIEFTPTVVPPQPTFAAWTTAWNVASQPVTSDADGDGLTLLMEYATGGSPHQPNPELVPTTSLVDGHFTLNVIKASSPTDLLYFVQGTRDLVPNSWTTSTVEVTDEDGTRLVARCKKPVAQEPNFNMRVRVLLAP